MSGEEMKRELFAIVDAHPEIIPELLVKAEALQAQREAKR